MNPKKLFRLGAVGTGVAAVCCFTPALVVLFGALGLSAALAWADYVLWPMLVLSAGLMVFAAMRMRATGTDAAACCPAPEAAGPERAGKERRA